MDASTSNLEDLDHELKEPYVKFQLVAMNRQQVQAVFGIQQNSYV